MTPGQMVIEFINVMCVEDREFKIRECEHWIAGRFGEWISTPTITAAFKKHCERVIHKKGPDHGNWRVSDKYKKAFLQINSS